MPQRSPRLRRSYFARRLNRRLAVETLEGRELLAGFNFTDFSSAGDLNLLGAAAITTDNRLRLTPAVGGQSGAAWYTADKQFVGSEFSTTFQFQMAENFDSPGGSDGFAFILQNFRPTYLAGGGGTLGYFGLQNSLAIEFDTFQNSEAADPSGSHISVHTNGTGPNSWLESLSLGSYNTNPILDDAAMHTAKVTYASGTLSIYLDDLTTPKLTVSVNLEDKLDLDVGRAWLGFTAATGGGYQTHDILNWSFDTTVPESIVSINNASVTEGNAGTSTLDFTVTRSGDVSAAATVNWTTQDATATAASGDYFAGSGQITFAPHETAQTISVLVQGDTALETHETLSVKLTSASSGEIFDGIGTGTILTDEVTVSIGDTQVVEGDPTFGRLGAFVSAGTGGLYAPYAMIVGPDGLIYMTGKDAHAVYRYDATGSPAPATGKPGAEFVSPGSGGLSQARDLAFGPDGALYAVSEGTDSVLRFDPATGDYLDTFVAEGSGGLDAPRGLTFQGGYAYVTSIGTESFSAGKDSVLRYDAATGAPAGVSGIPGDAVFIPSGSGGLDNPSRLVFGPDGKAYVSSTATVAVSPTSNSVLRYDAMTGAPAGISPGSAVFVSPGSGGLDGPVAMHFRPDGLYVTSWRNNSALRYNSATGAYLSTVVSSSVGLASALDLLFEADGNILVSSLNTNEIVRVGPRASAVFNVTLSSPSALPVTVDFTTASGTALAGSDYTPASGTMTFAPGESVKTILVRTLQDAQLEADETFAINLSNASSGATIVDNQAVGTIVDPGHEVLVNTTTAGAQMTNILPGSSNPHRGTQSVASDSAGNYVVVWQGNGIGDADGIFFQRYDNSGARLGSETRVNVTTSGAQTNPVVGKAASNGKFVVAWRSNNGVYARVFNANGTAASNEVTVAAGSSSTSNAIDSIAVDADGDFAVLYKQFASSKGLSEKRYWQVQRVSAAGQLQGSSIRTTTLNLINGQGGIASDASGNFVVVWDESNGIQAQRFSNAGKKVGSQIVVNPSGGGANVARDADGDFVVTWNNSAQVFNNDGSRRGGVLTFSEARGESIAMQPGGEFVLSWTTNSLVYAQRFNASGVALEAIRKITRTTPGIHEQASVAVAGDGSYIVAWNTPVYQSNGAAGSTLLDSDVRARRVPIAMQSQPSSQTFTPDALTQEQLAVALAAALDELDDEAGTFDWANF